VYAGFFPVSNDQYKELKEAIEKLALSDSALRYEPENSPVLGFGLRIGFLGLLHMDIIKERLEREFELDLIVTNPSTNYEVVMNNGEIREIKSAADLPDVSEVKEIREPWVKGEIILPKNMIGNVLNLINEKRGHQTNVSYIEDRAVIDFEAPMANLLTDFYDQLKSATSGYASFNYELNGYKAANMQDYRLSNLDTLYATGRFKLTYFEDHMGDKLLMSTLIGRSLLTLGIGIGQFGQTYRRGSIA
jgi:GTP-binding protein LepA